MTSGHTDREYEAHLDDVRTRLRRMAELVEAMMSDAVDALVAGDAERARATMNRDATIDRLEMESDELCLHTVARWQPVASDLRFVTVAFKVVTDLERIGDLAVNICERAIDMEGHGEAEHWDRVKEMSSIVCGMVRDATDALVELDVEKAEDVIDRDETVDDMYTEIFREILGEMKGADTPIRDGIHIQSVVKWLERAADHATNLAEQAIFLARGEDVRHPRRLPRKR